MPGVFLWGWCETGTKWVKILVNEQGKLIIDPSEIVSTIANLDDIGDVSVVAPGDDEVLYWDDAAGKWLAKANWVAAHKDSHDPEDGADKLDTAIAVKVGEANAVGTSHSLARADHVHEKHHAKYTDANAVSAMGAKADVNPLHHDIYANADAVAAVKADAGLPVASITFVIGVIGTVITTGLKGDLEIPFACTINRVTLLANKSGSIVIDIWKQAYADYPPENAQSIVAAAPPTITTAEKSQDSTLTDWTTAIAAGDCLRYNVDSITDIEQVTISLKVTKT